LKIRLSCISWSSRIRYDPLIAVGKPVGKVMGRQINKLSARKVETVSQPGRHSDGAGLYLNVTESGGRSWLFMYKAGGRRREMGLGSVRDVPLVQARKFAANARQQLASGLDPLTARQKPATMTFAEAASALVESMSPAWRNAKHRAQWNMTLTVYCAPIATKAVTDVTTDDVLRVLKPLWLSKPETGSRLRGRIERALDFAKARGMRSGENPARWRGHLDALLPKRQKLTRGHHKAMAFDDVPEFSKQWSEVDLTARVWTVPATRMKGGREHRVPLSDRAVQILNAMQARKVSEFIFPGSKPNRPLSVMALEMVLRRAKVDATVHGFRSAFRDWSGERTAFPREVAEAALAHLVGDETERAYRRGDALEKRRGLMDAWSIFCAASQENTVVPLKRRKAD
jgi:integrase